jgi:hypothetical protein
VGGGGGWGGIGDGGRQSGRCHCQGGDFCVVGRGYVGQWTSRGT